MNCPEIDERVIRPGRGARVEWRQLLRYRDLLFLLVRRDFVSRYQQTILGPIWFVLQPLVATGAFTLIFSRGLGTSTDGISPPFLFYQCGMLAWAYFATVVGAAGNTFQTNAPIFTKVYFPRLIVPLATAIGGLVPFVLQLVVFLAIYLPVVFSIAKWQPYIPALVVLPLALGQVAALALGVALLTSGLSAKYRDLQHALPFLLQLGLFLTPVVYPLGKLSPAARSIAALNPLTAPIELCRLGFFGVGTVTGTLIMVSLAGTGLLLLLGGWVFQRAERTFADTV